MIFYTICMPKVILTKILSQKKTGQGNHFYLKYALVKLEMSKLLTTFFILSAQKTR